MSSSTNALTTTDLILKLQGPVLVTGANGFIGASFLRALSGIRDDVIGTYRNTPGWRLSDVQQHNLKKCDLRDGESVKKVVDQIRPKTVFHFAAYGAYSNQLNPTLIYGTNLGGTSNLLTCLSETVGNEAVIVSAGTSSEYGKISKGPREDSVCEPNSDYSVSKLLQTELLERFSKLHQIPAVTLRLYSVYGDLEEPTRLFPTAVRAGRAGTFPPFVDPTISRDFVYISDVIDAFLRAALNAPRLRPGEIINIGTGRQTTIAEFASLLKAEFRLPKDPSFSTMPNRRWDLEEWSSNSQKAIEAIGWEASTTLEQGMRYLRELIPENATGAGEISSSSNTNASQKISAVVACFKDASAIPEMYSRLTTVFENLVESHEIIFVNDASPDNSAEVLARIAKEDERVIVVTHTRNFGSQMAFLSGIEESSGDYVVVLDGDLQDPPELIPEMYRRATTGKEVVVGRRVKRDMPFPYEIAYKIFYRLFSWLSEVPLPLDAGDFSLFSKNVAKQLLAVPERDYFFRGIRAFLGHEWAEVPYVRPERKYGRSTNSLWKNLTWARKAIFAFSTKPLSLLSIVGTVFTALSASFGVYLLLVRFLVPTTVPDGLTTVLLVTVLFGSLSLLGLGVLGEYIAKIIVESKGRPRYIRKSVYRNGATVSDP